LSRFQDGQQHYRHHAVLRRRGIAVVVSVVAPLGRAGVNIGFGVIAVGSVRHPSGQLVAVPDRVGGIAEAVAIGVEVPQRRDRIEVGGPVTIVVAAVADLVGIGGHRGIAVVAVDRGREAVAVPVGLGRRLGGWR
jgi:hypothetical protein